MPFLIIFVCIPLIEVTAFAYVGDEIGVINTLLFCLLTAAIGGFLVRHQGISTLIKAQGHLRSGQLPLNEIFEGFCLVIAGALLLTPGFVTDGVGFSLLIPPVRDLLKYFLGKRTSFTSTHHQQSTTHPSDSNVVEGEYETVVKKPETLDREP